MARMPDVHVLDYGHDMAYYGMLQAGEAAACASTPPRAVATYPHLAASIISYGQLECSMLITHRAVACDITARCEASCPALSGLP